MSNDPWSSPRLSEDVEFRPVSGPERYTHSTDKPIQYFTVANDQDGVIGYLWACDADNAAGWEPRPAAGDIAYNGSRPWLMRLREAKANGLAPFQALVELSDEPGDPVTGHLVPGSQNQTQSLAALKEIAQQA